MTELAVPSLESAAAFGMHNLRVAGAITDEASVDILDEDGQRIFAEYLLTCPGISSSSTVGGISACFGLTVVGIGTKTLPGTHSQLLEVIVGSVLPSHTPGDHNSRTIIGVDGIVSSATTGFLQARFALDLPSVLPPANTGNHSSALNISLDDIPSGAVVGLPEFWEDGKCTLVGIPSSAVFGSLKITLGLDLSGIPSIAVVETPARTVSVAVAGMDSPAVTGNHACSLELSPVGTPSAVKTGNHFTSFICFTAAGISPAATVGASVLTTLSEVFAISSVAVLGGQHVSSLILATSGIVSATIHGRPEALQIPVLVPSAVLSAAVLGDHAAALNFTVTGISSETVPGAQVLITGPELSFDQTLALLFDARAAIAHKATANNALTIALTGKASGQNCSASASAMLPLALETIARTCISRASTNTLLFPAFDASGGSVETVATADIPLLLSIDVQIEMVSQILGSANVLPIILDARIANNPISVALEVSYSILIAATSVLSDQYDLADRAEVFLDAPYALLAETALLAIYSIGTHVNASLECRWHNTIEASLEARYDAPVSVALEATYATIIETCLEAVWSITTPVETVLEVSWVDTQAVSVDLEVVWAILDHTPVSIGLEAIWDILADQEPVMAVSGIEVIHFGMRI